MNLRQPVRFTHNGLPVNGFIVGRCFHDGEMHFDIREGRARIHADVPAKQIEVSDGND